MCSKCYCYLCVITGKMVISSTNCTRLVRKFLAIYRIRRFITEFTRCRRCFRSHPSPSGDLSFTYLACTALGNFHPRAPVWYLWQILASASEVKDWSRTSIRMHRPYVVFASQFVCIYVWFVSTAFSIAYIRPI